MLNLYNKINHAGLRRAQEIVRLCCAITKIGTREVKAHLKKSYIYREIKNQNEAYLYDSASANLIEIIRELKEAGVKWRGCECITVESVSRYNYNKRIKK